MHVTYKGHMNKKNETLAVLTKEREEIRENAETVLHEKRNEMKDNKNADSEEMELMTQKIFEEDELTRKYEERVRQDLEDEEAKLR